MVMTRLPIEKRTEQYAEQLAALMPPGLALSTDDPSSDLYEILRRMAVRLDEVDDFFWQILRESAPRSAINLLSEWEQALALPDSCTIGTPTLDERQRAAYAKYTDRGGARIPRYISIANALGYNNVQTQRYAMHTCESDCETPLYEQVDRFRWSLVLNEGTRVVDSTCEDDCETPLQIWGDAQIECVINRENPAIAEVNFIYNG